MIKFGEENHQSDADRENFVVFQLLLLVMLLLLFVAFRK